MKLPKFSNQAVAKLLREVAAAYEVKDGDFFKVKAYGNAADAMEQATSEIKDLWEEGNLGEISGVGPSLEKYLDEYFRIGKVRHFDKVKRGLPPGMFEILGVPTIGPKRAYRLAKELKIRSQSDLRKACETRKVSNLSGFGEESESDILRGLDELERRNDRLLLPLAVDLAERIIAYLSRHPKVLQADPLGSLRRGVSTIGDIDIGVSTHDGAVVTKYFTEFPEVWKVVSLGEVKATVILKSGHQVDIVTQRPVAYGSLLQYFTGSKAHNIHLRSLALKMGYSASEHGIKRVSDGELSQFGSEEDFYRFLGLPCIPPEVREDAGEIEAAQKGKLPKLINLSDIKGDLHIHSNFIEGESTVEEILSAAESLGYDYIGISDHNPSVKARGLGVVKKDLERRKDELLKISEKAGTEVFNGIEMSITRDGEMSLPDEILETFDYVIASIHTVLGAPSSLQTDRVLRAIRNPFVDIIGHPTGRLLNQREGYELDWEKVFEACLKYDKALEINSYPTRLDLPDILVRQAINRGVKLSINSDAHSADSLDNIRFGVTVARRGWAKESDIINSFGYEKMKSWLVGRRSRKKTT